MSKNSLLILIEFVSILEISNISFAMSLSFSPFLIIISIYSSMVESFIFDFNILENPIMGKIGFRN